MDAGQRYTEKSIRDLKARFADVYAQAEREMADKLEDYVTRHEARVEKQKAKLEAGKITKADYDAWMRGQIFQQKQWEAKAKSISDTLVRSDEIVQRMINGKQVDVFAANANWMSYQMEHGAGINFGFGLYDNATVTRLIRDNPDLLPPKLVQYKADSAWYQKKITNCVTQGIIQGEGLEEITQRIMRDAKESSESHAIRNARTAMTGAQNAGRVQSMLEAEKLGIDVKKRWMATLDTKTRDAHQKLDGQEVEPDEFFEVDGQYIRYPGDPHAEPELVQNCRCTLVNTYPKYPSKFKRRDNIDGQVIKDMTYTEWFKAKFAEQANEPEAEQKYKQIKAQDTKRAEAQKPALKQEQEPTQEPKPAQTEKPAEAQSLQNVRTDYTLAELDKMSRAELERIARAVAVKMSSAQGITESAALRRFSLLIKQNTTPQLKKYINRYKRNIAEYEKRKGLK